MTARRALSVRVRALALVGLLGLGWAASASAQTGLLGWLKPRGEEGAMAGDGEGQAAVVLPAGARAEKDLAYGEQPLQNLDVYIPAQARKAPILLMVHGGAWMLGDKANKGVVPNKVAHFLPKGWIVVSINYRLDKAKPNALDQVDDLARALAYVQQHATGWGGDPRHVVLMGHSSGAHLVSMLTADPQLAQAHGAQPTLGTVALDSAVFDLVEIMERRHYGFYDRVFGKDRQHWLANSPYHRLKTTPQPMLLVCSSKRSDSCPQADKYADKVLSLGGRAQVLKVAASHGAINGDLGKVPDYTRQVEDFMTGLLKR
ncbi:MAG: alpha/beta fold hydrolase [Rubrivivax sp.]